MIKKIIDVRVRYSETDQMGFVYYGNYAQYLELGRVAAMKSAGVVYSDLEKQGIGLPVRQMNITYKKAAKYDDLIQVETTITKMPNRIIEFNYLIKCDDEILAEAYTSLMFMDKTKLKVINIPEKVELQLKPFFN